MNETAQVPVNTGAAKAREKARSRVGRLLALLSVLRVEGRPRPGTAASLPPRRRFVPDLGYPATGGSDLGRGLR
ncbi:MAG: hypothetical protein R3291_02335 [Thermoplasmata archaeon]|nr:hypothetical protein [Thermoplasmata archaeon]